MSQVTILIDADACPVKEEVYKVAFRRKLPVVLVANAWLRHPDSPLISMHQVGSEFDAADDAIAEVAGPKTLIVTADILLAERCLKSGATVVSPTGKPFTMDNIGTSIATRAIMADLRGAGDQVGGGPAPFSGKDRSRFLQTLDTELARMTRPG